MQTGLPQAVAVTLAEMQSKDFPLKWSIQDTDGYLQIKLQWKKSQQSCASKFFSSSSRIKSDARKERDMKRFFRFQQQKNVVGNFSGGKPQLKESSTQTHQVHSSIKSTQTTVTSTSTATCTDPIPESKTAAAQTEDPTVKTENPKISCVDPEPKPRTEKVIRRRVRRNKQEYLIQYNNYPIKKNAWVPEHELDNHALKYIKDHEKKISGPKLQVTSRKPDQPPAHNIDFRSEQHTFWMPQQAALMQQPIAWTNSVVANSPYIQY